MNLVVRRSPRATAEILGIVTQLAENSPAAARRFLDQMQQAYERIAAFPNSGVAGITPGTRRLIVGDDILSYRMRQATVEVFAVRHAKRRDARL